MIATRAPIATHNETGIVPMRPEHAAEVAAIHRSVLPESIYSVLGQRFLEYYYRNLLKNKSFFGYVQVFEKRVTGFAAATSESMSVFWRQIALDGWRIGGVLAQTLIERPAAIRTAAQAFGFLLTERCAMLPAVKGELLSFAVLPAYRVNELGPDGAVRSTAFYATQHVPVAAELFRSVVRELARREVRDLKIMTGAANTASNRFYAKMGCRLLPERFTAFGYTTHLYYAEVESLI